MMSGATHQLGRAYDSAQRVIGQLVLVIRKDAAATGTDPDDLSLVDDSDFSSLTVDKLGYLRVRTPPSGVPVSEVLTLEERLDETNSLLRRLVLAMEMIHDQPLADPQ